MLVMTSLGWNWHDLTHPRLVRDDKGSEHSANWTNGAISEHRYRGGTIQYTVNQLKPLN